MKLSSIKPRSDLSFVEAALAYIDGMSDDEVLDLTDLALAIGRGKPSRCFGKLEECRVYVFVAGQHRFVYGNRKAISKLKKQLKTNLKP